MSNKAEAGRASESDALVREQEEGADLSDRTTHEDAAPTDLDPRDVVQRQNREAEEFALEFLKKVLRLRGVRIDRSQFLTAELHKRGCSTEVIEQAIAGTPVVAGLSVETLDGIADAAIRFETRKSSAMSFAAGIPGGAAMAVTVPSDLMQYYVHAFRVMQKLAFVYGWQSLIHDMEQVDDETVQELAGLLGVMLGVGAASGAVTRFATQMAAPAVQKQIAQKALTKTLWYAPMKQVLRYVGVSVTKQSLASAVAKTVPVVGGAVSGGLTLVALQTQSGRLKRHLRETPPPHVDAEEYLAALRHTDEANGRHESSGGGTRWVVPNPADLFRPVDRDGDGVPDEPLAAAAVKGTLSAVGNSLAGATSLLRRRGETEPEESAGGDEPKAARDVPDTSNLSEQPTSDPS